MRKSLIFLLLGLALLVAGCGGGNDGYDDGYDDGYYNNPNNNPGGYTPPPSGNPQLLAYYDSYDALSDTILSVDDFSGVLGNDIYTSGTTYIDFPLTTVQGGDITSYADGSFDYDPPVGFVGDDSFTYTLSDDFGQSSSADVFLHVYPTSARRIKTSH